MAERSKALVLGTNLLGGKGSNPGHGIFRTHIKSSFKKKKQQEGGSATLPLSLPKFHINYILNSCSAVSTPEVYGLYILFTTCFL